MSEDEKELEKKINMLDGVGEDDAEATKELEGERERMAHARNR